MTATRFAPSPTGPLHLGHLYSAALARGWARRQGAAFRLRIEDIDPGRARAEHVAAILDDLDWAGIDWDGEPIVQSMRLPAHCAALDALRERGLLYPCFCTRADIAASASAPHGPGGALYPGTCRRLSPAECTGRLAREPHAWRLDMSEAAARAGPLRWFDEEAGWIEADPCAHGDVILARKDAPTSYQLAVTLDDAADGITHVIRGRDLFHATDVQRLLRALLNLAEPTYRHHRLIAGPDGRRLAKRDGASLAELRARGVDPAALVADLEKDRLPSGFFFADT
ncbi:MAG: Glutamyl-Q tRNA(Asp) synthetase [uncultured Sphingomonadaceae bacterium]|uniref:Glutamyl-Q tRNA(Asp) synthetase n=1 Tax=uncultured Sphingomonadaceae bacterium TaxID=169976 RepID=A0A6J4SBY0_9SPHN|nr:MAG: Glutamyl-Q tRNA(Asp) synthetase [uncultured Sphingomonadaceae bacterium]